MPLRIHYKLSTYRSHRRVGAMYMDCIRADHELVDSPADADVVILHLEPKDYAAIYEGHPSLRDKYVIAYCVWEASRLPGAYIKSISLVQEIWTCSAYCQRLFAEHHGNVVRVPHVVERPSGYSPADLTHVRELISYEPGRRYLLTVTKLWDKRKNTSTLIRIVGELSSTLPESRLVVKTDPEDRLPPKGPENVIFVRELLTDGQMNALLSTADVYVSAHHSEGWGLPLSDAMSFNLPVIATGYSGNLEFMTPENSFLVNYDECCIRPSDCFGSFDESMRWAYPREDHLAELIVAVCRQYGTRMVQDRCVRAGQDVARYSRQMVQRIILERLREIERNWRRRH